MFTVNGTPQFLVFVSHFDAMDVSTTNLNSDFAYLHGKGVDGIRIFPNWWDVRQDVWSHPIDPYYFDSGTLISPSGALQSAPLSKFLQVLDIAKNNGLLVDVSFSAETVAVCSSGNCTQGNPDGAYLTYTSYKNAIASVASTLAGYGSAYKHVFFDLQNEYNENGAGGPAFTNSQILSIRNAVKSADSGRLVTASVSHSDSAASAALWQLTTNVDSIAWHEDRDPGFWTRVASRIGDMHQQNPDPPIYLQEPERHPLLRHRS